MKDIVLVFCIGTGVAGAGVFQGVEIQRTDQRPVITDQEGLFDSRHETPRFAQVVTTWRSEYAP